MRAGPLEPVSAAEHWRGRSHPRVGDECLARAVGPASICRPFPAPPPLPRDATRSPALAGLAAVATAGGFGFTAPSNSSPPSPAGPDGDSGAPDALVAFGSMPLATYQEKQDKAGIIARKIDQAKAKYTKCDVCGVTFDTLESKERLICCSAPSTVLGQLYGSDDAEAVFQQVPFSPASVGSKDRTHVHQCCFKCAGGKVDAAPRTMAFFCGSFNSLKIYAPTHGCKVDNVTFTTATIKSYAASTRVLRDLTAMVPFWVDVAESRWRDKGKQVFSTAERQAFERCFKLHPALKGPLGAAKQQTSEGERPILMGLCAPCVSAYVDWLLVDDRSPWRDAVESTGCSKISSSTFPLLHHASSKPAVNTAADAFAELGGEASEVLKDFASMQVEAQQQPPEASNGQNLRREAASDPAALRRLREERGAIAPPPPARADELEAAPADELEATPADEPDIAPIDELGGFDGVSDSEEAAADDEQEDGTAARAEEEAQAAAQLREAQKREEAAREQAVRTGHERQRLAEEVATLRTRQEEMEERARLDLKRAQEKAKADVEQAEAAVRKKVEMEAAKAAKEAERKRKADEKKLASALAAARKSEKAAAEKEQAANAALDSMRKKVKTAKTVATAAAEPAAGAQGAARRKACQAKQPGPQHVDKRATGDFDTIYQLNKARIELNKTLGLPHNYPSMKAPDKHTAMCAVRDELVALREFKAKAEAGAGAAPNQGKKRKAAAPAPATKAVADTDEAAADTDEEEIEQESAYLRAHTKHTIPDHMLLVPKAVMERVLDGYRDRYQEAKELYSQALDREEQERYRKAVAVQHLDTTVADAREFIAASEAREALRSRAPSDSAEATEIEDRYNNALAALKFQTPAPEAGFIDDEVYDEQLKVYATGETGEGEQADPKAPLIARVEDRMKTFDETVLNVVKGDRRFAQNLVPFTKDLSNIDSPPTLDAIAYEEYDFKLYNVDDVVLGTKTLDADAKDGLCLMQVTEVFAAGFLHPGVDDEDAKALQAQGEIYYELIDKQNTQVFYRKQSQLFATDSKFEPSPPPQSNAAGKRRVSFEAPAAAPKRARGDAHTRSQKK